jgi:glycosyltransferase involved in cell wall biosynthesis
MPMVSSAENRQNCEMNVTLYTLPKLSFLVVSHVAFTGHAQELEDFLKQYAHKLMFIAHPFSYASQKKSTAKFYENGIFKTEAKAPQVNGPEILLYLKDFLATFYFVLKFRTKFHVYVGVDPLNSFVGLFFKRLGFAKLTVFYVIDYVPVRFKNIVLNSIYHSIDRICVRYADYIWNLTSAMASARERRGIRKDKTKQIIVPTGTHFEKTRHLVAEHLDGFNIVFLSHLRKGQGIELVLEALPEVVNEIPSVKLIVIGTGPLEQYFKEEVTKRKLEHNVIFLGYIEDHSEIEKIVSKCKVGIAPYVPDSESFTWYADPGKPKVYVSCGVPVIITKVPEVAFEISKRDAGIAINYDAHELSETIIKILCDDNLYQIYRANAMKFASEMEWNTVFIEAISKILN